MSEHRITIGDLVSVNFNNAQTTLTRDAIVIYVPVASGDSWIFKCKDTGFIHHVSEGCTVSKNYKETNE